MEDSESTRNDSTCAIAPRYRWATAAAADAATADTTDDAPPGPDTGLYTAIVKTTDAGATWSVVYTNEGNFLLSGIDCADALHCIAVGSGGSEPPSAEYSVIYATSDGGATWKQTDKQVGGAHCLDVRFVGPSEAWAACYAASDPLHIDGHFKHTTDAGATWYTNELKGAILLGFDMFDAHHGWATVFHYASGACGIAKFSTTAPTPPPTPPPSPPRPGQTHYGDPYLGTCESDERNLTVTGAVGQFCAPICTGGVACPADVPKGVTVDPKCALSDGDTGEKNCALICDPYANDKQCGEHASCKDLGNGEGICTYDLVPTPAPTPAPPTPPPVPTPRSPAHYGNPYTGSCLADETNSTTRDDDSGQNLTYNACAPTCAKKAHCPTDIPPGNTTTFPDAGPRCENFNVPGHPLQHDKHCVLVCMVDTDCPGYHNGNVGSSSCFREVIPVLGHGFCGYVPPGAQPSLEGDVVFTLPRHAATEFVQLSFSPSL